MTPLEIAKKALKEIVNTGYDIDAQMLALEALTEIAIEEQEAPKPKPVPHSVKRLFGGHH